MAVNTTDSDQPDPHAGLARVLLGFAGIAFFIVAIILVGTRHTASVITEVTTGVLTSQASPSPVAGSTAAPQPSNLGKTGAASGDGSKTTTTESATSDSVVLGLFGLAVVLGLAAAFFPRIQKISLPGGAGINLYTKYAELLPQAAAHVPAAIAAIPAAAAATPETRAARAAAATNLAAARAAELASLGKRSSGQQRIALAAAAGISPQEVEQLVRTGSPSPQLWDRLAKDAVAEATQQIPG